MKSGITKILTAIILFTSFLLKERSAFARTNAADSVNARHPISQEEVIKLATEAYIYGLPLVFTDFTRQAGQAKNNVFNHGHKFPDHTSRWVVAPNNDTNYSSAFLDLGDDAIVLNIPDTKERYYVVPLMDAWTNVFASFGKRTTGTKPQQYLITGPKWKGIVPGGLKEVKSPTDLVWIIGRIQVNSPDDQVNFVSKIQDQFTITKLADWGKQHTSQEKITTYEHTPAIITEVKSKQVNLVQAIKKISITGYFNYLNDLLVKNPPLPADKELLSKIEQIGIKPGGLFNLAAFDAETQAKLNALPAQIYATFDSGGNQLSAISSKGKGKIGDYGTDFLLRARVAYGGLGALTPEEATYIGYSTDADKEKLSGENKYVVHFGKGKLPPSTAFWSLTMYGTDRYLVDNPIKRYAIGDRNPLKFNADGSLDIYVQHDNPGKEKENNWLPAPAEGFNVVLRIYVPTKQYLSDHSTWPTPPLQKQLTNSGR
ncbi:DUF1254 domain-containing protein [Pedobacter sp. HMF7647]|uniref:DUF1254 domain-containing protein n=1 Tax=Hufsiella arboris TaxID=2695275 RepID=A0A7K1YBB9_9SPHI|nr:DUF1254 domain-containing protein [Hufsiella arboris]MXV51892.1 DUF1254 domain-containing protein [Hufsiella arboris]